MLTTIKEILQAALDYLGPNGEKWIKNPPQKDADGVEYGKPTCAALAIKTVWKAQNESRWDFRVLHSIRALNNAAGGSSAEFNDRPETTFEDIKALFKKAMEGYE